jgi:RNA polymerase sigma-54 factor
MALMRLSPEDRAALWTLIESLDADGYLADPLEEIAERLGAADAADASEVADGDGLLERLQCALKWLQSLDPAGVGARSLAECLTLQLRAQPQTPAHTLAADICREHLDLLARREFKKLSAVTGADEAQLREARDLIVHCDPKPGRAFGQNDSRVVVPDVIVQRSGRVWKVQLNPDVMPKLRINDLYAQAIRGQRNGTAAGLNARLQEARWFVKNIQQRFDTIVRVSQAIVERQKGFFTHGAIAMKPLVLREIADELGLHESTISRVTTAKYMSTPYGTYELKYFFGSSLSTDAGGNASSTAVRALLRQLVAAEDPKAPLSDGQLAQMLSEQGIQVARRTVAKYREAMKIAPANLRRNL